ncbi:glucokinase [Parasphingorhabdus marina DSM 22363]|uniref:Glucokinase n=1 Tax=Parasphingorhabdus marina DSM 22363 TaxID=1123272 RepID=A0A1N6D0Y6_9SPHN|nr:glucokinase [Parasphingorhabdus marina]SIN64441.1 glucokinase [Parasphingorhabdus marina DSM 22363]
MPVTVNEIVIADIGGTHARFAIANISDARNIAIDREVTMECSAHASLQIAWQAYARAIGQELPRRGTLAVAAPVNGEDVCFTNSSWKIRPGLIGEKLKLDQFSLINDFGAVCHAIAALDAIVLDHVCGPDIAAPEKGIITVLGPGTGLGVAHILRSGDEYTVTETEGGHVDFAPHDELEDQLLVRLRKVHGRVSVERVVAGPGLQEIYRLMAQLEGSQAKQLTDKDLWQLALSGDDAIAAAAFDRFCLCLGSVAGDLALAQGAQMVVLAGGLGNRIADQLPSSGFKKRFVAKGRFQSMMEKIPVRQLTHKEPGLYGAAVAFLREHGQ